MIFDSCYNIWLSWYKCTVKLAEIRCCRLHLNLLIFIFCTRIDAHIIWFIVGYKLHFREGNAMRLCDISFMLHGLEELQYICLPEGEYVHRFLNWSSNWTINLYAFLPLTIICKFVEFFTTHSNLYRMALFHIKHLICHYWRHAWQPWLST